MLLKVGYFVFLCITYFGSSYQFVNTMRRTKNKKIKNRITLLNNKLQKYVKYNLSSKKIGYFLDSIKCLFFVISSIIIFGNKTLTDLVAIASLAGNYFPLFGIRKNQSKNFLSVIIVGLFLDAFTGISMVFAFALTLKYGHHKSIAITSAMFMGIMKSIVHISIFSNKDYIEALYFIIFGILAIYCNKKTLLYICTRITRKNKVKKVYDNHTKIGKEKRLKYSERANSDNKLYKDYTIKIKKLKNLIFKKNNQDKYRKECKNSNKYKKHKTYEIKEEMY